METFYNTCLNKTARLTFQGKLAKQYQEIVRILI